TPRLKGDRSKATVPGVKSSWSRPVLVGSFFVCSMARTSVAADGGRVPSADAAALDASVRRDGAPAGDGSTLDAPLPPPRHVVGKSCGKDADCAAGLVCLTATGNSLRSGGPAGGLCTLSCSAHSQADCNAVDTGSVCISDTDHTFSYCYELCAEGPV